MSRAPKRRSPPELAQVWFVHLVGEEEPRSIVLGSFEYRWIEGVPHALWCEPHRWEIGISVPVEGTQQHMAPATQIKDVGFAPKAVNGWPVKELERWVFQTLIGADRLATRTARAWRPEPERSRLDEIESVEIGAGKGTDHER